MYIDGLAKLLEHHGIIAKLFADDVKIYLLIKNDLDVSQEAQLSPRDRAMRRVS